MALFTEGKLFKKAGEGSGGGGGGDQHNLGWYETSTALNTAHPTASAGDWAIVGATDTVWIWDTDNSAWVDSDQKGQVTSVNNQTGAVTITADDILPTQTGNAGKFLTTNGTEASWETISALQNIATNSTSVYITDRNASTVFQVSSAVVLGQVGGAGYPNAVSEGSVIIGCGAYSLFANNSIAIGVNAVTRAVNSIQFGQGTNSDANTVKIANANGNFEIMSADGTIPKERLVNVVTTPSTMPTLAVADWSNNTQTVSVTGVTATNTVFVSPAPASAADYASAGIVCTAQGNGTLSFTCTTTPTNAITVNVVCL